MGSCIRRRSSAFTSFNFVCNLLRIVCRSTVYIPLLLFFTQICVKPRKLNVSGFPSPRRCRLLIANGPNSSSRVFSGCNSRWNFLILSVSSARNCSASALLWNPTTISSANRTTITSPCDSLSRSEEHPSEIQSRREIVCHIVREKKLSSCDSLTRLEEHKYELQSRR